MIRRSKKFTVGIVLIVIGIFGLVGILSFNYKMYLFTSGVVLIVIGAMFLSVDYYMRNKRHVKNDATLILPSFNTPFVSIFNEQIKKATEAPTQNITSPIELPGSYDSAVLINKYNNVSVAQTELLPAVIFDSLYGKTVRFETVAADKSVTVFYTDQKIGYLQKDDNICNMVYDSVLRKDTVIGKVSFVDSDKMKLGLIIGIYRK
ncbi:MAG: hypothetical protein ACYCWE_17280 [Eubacteriales bacterium]